LPYLSGGWVGCCNACPPITRMTPSYCSERCCVSARMNGTKSVQRCSALTRLLGVTPPPFCAASPPTHTHIVPLSSPTAWNDEGSEQPTEKIQVVLTGHRSARERQSDRGAADSPGCEASAAAFAWEPPAGRVKKERMSPACRDSRGTGARSVATLYAE
jgi:hypothetical protein